jgi:uncharacterized phage protein gp47/JayE
MPLTPEGLEIPTVTELVASLVAQEREEIDPLIDVDAESPVGQINGIFANELRKAYEAIAVAYHAIDPDAAEGAELETLAAITGTFKAAATRSQFVGLRSIEVELEAATTLPAGSTCEVFGASTTRFETTSTVVSTSAGWYPVEARCTQAGPVDVAPMTLTVITTPVAGWLAVRNPTGPVLGKDVDSAEELRDRRERELRAIGSAPAEAIASRIAAIEVDGERPVISCTVFENTSSVTDPILLLPPHSIEALVWDGIGQDAPDDLIAQTIFGAKAAGVGTFGSASGTARTNDGEPRTIRFSRPTLRVVGVEGEISVVQGFSGIGAVRQIVVDYFDSIPPGARDTKGEIRWSLVAREILRVPGVISVDLLEIAFAGDVGSALFTNLVCGPRDKPVGSLVAVDITGVSVGS